MIWRVMVVVCGGAVIAAATHLNVEHAGGYAADGAPLVIAMAALLTVGMGFVGMLWNERRWAAAIGLTLCIVAGEVYWFCINAEREVAAREKRAVPTAAARESRRAAERRLEQAEAGKRAVDEAAVTEAAKPGRKAYCTKALSDTQSAANQELAAARSSLAALPLLRAADPLPARLGVAPWAWDLWMAALRSVAVMGASISVGLGLHSRGSKPRVLPSIGSPERDARLQIEDFTNKKKRSKPKKIDAREHVSEFMMQSVRQDPAGTASLRDLHARYLTWCKSNARKPLTSSELGRELRTIVDAVGLQCEAVGNDVIVRGAVIG